MCCLGGFTFCACIAETLAPVLMQAWNLLWATPDSRKFCYTRHIVASPATDWSSPWSILRSLFKIMCLLFPRLHGLSTHIPKVALICRIWLRAELCVWLLDRLLECIKRSQLETHSCINFKYMLNIYIGVPSMVHTNAFNNKAIVNACLCLFPISSNGNILLFCDRVWLGYPVHD